MSLRRAVDNFCRYCIYDKGGSHGSWRQQVEACTAKKCPLFDVRAKPISVRRSDTEKTLRCDLACKLSQIDSIIE